METWAPVDTSISLPDFSCFLLLEALFGVALSDLVKTNPCVHFNLISFGEHLAVQRRGPAEGA